MIEYKSVVYNAARDGNLRRLKVFLDCRSDSDVRALLSSCTFGTPPLVIAARNGHVDVARYLVERNVDLEQPGCVTFDGETIDSAPALWCAAAAGKLDLVQFLTERGAQVNHATATNSTPLRAACFDGHLKIVKYLVNHGADIEIANRHGHTSLMIACYRGHVDVVKFLLSMGANVDAKSSKGNTALHDSAESGNVQIVELLLQHEARPSRDCNGLTPLLSAAGLGHSLVVDFLCRRQICTPTECVDGLLLLGATFVDKKRDIVGAFCSWRQALALRRQHGLQPEISAPTPDVLLAYDGQREALDEQQLDLLTNDPDKIRMQSLILRERILGPSHPDTTYYIRYRGAVYADVGVFDRCIDLWLYALGIQQSLMDPLCALTLNSFMSFAELFCFLLNDSSPANPNAAHNDQDENDNALAHRNSAAQGFADSNVKRVVKFDDIYIVLKVALAEVDRSTFNSEFCGCDEGLGSHQTVCRRQHLPDKQRQSGCKLLLIILHLLALAHRCLRNERHAHFRWAPHSVRAESPAPPSVCESSTGGGSGGVDVNGSIHWQQPGGSEMEVGCSRDAELRRCAYSLLRADPRGARRTTLLHMACNEDSTTLGALPLCRFPSTPVIDVLLDAGADVNAVDAEGNTPLHVCLSNKIHRPSVATRLLDNGACLLVRNRAGETPADFIKTSGIGVPSLKYLSLKLLAGAEVRRHGLVYRNRLPPGLEHFLDKI